MFKTKRKIVGSAKPDYGFSGGFLTVAQNIGKSLVYPIAVLPIAAILLRFGTLFQDLSSAQFDVLWWIGFILRTPGAAVFDNLAIIFAIGVAFGFSKDRRGESALVGAVSYLVLIGLVQQENSLASLYYENVFLIKGVDSAGNAVEYSKLLYIVPQFGTVPGGTEQILGNSVWMLNLGIFGGIEAGIISAYAYNRWSGTKLHPALGFFSGRRFVPMVAIVIMTIVSFVTAAIWPWLQLLLVMLSEKILLIPSLGAGIYTFLNRLLLPFGLHQVINVFFWFQMPITYEGAQIMYMNGGQLVPVLGDINAYSNAATYVTQGIQIGSNFYVGDKVWDILKESHVGAFQTGFFPIMMSGTVAAAFAIAMSADKVNRRKVLAFMMSAAFVSFLTCITEPVEYSFMFVSPLLYLIYSLLAGIVSSLTVLTGVSFGFGFSAGLIDLVLSAPVAIHLSTSGALAYAISDFINATFPGFYTSTYATIRGLNLATPGRGGNMTGINEDYDEDVATEGDQTVKQKDSKELRMAKETIVLVGGVDNIYEIDNCITRVRLKVKNNNIDQNDVKKIGYIGYSKVGNNAAQFIIGPESEIIAKHILDLKNKHWTGDQTSSDSSTLDEQKDKIINDETIKDSSKEKINNEFSQSTEIELLEDKELEKIINEVTDEKIGEEISSKLDVFSDKN